MAAPSSSNIGANTSQKKVVPRKKWNDVEFNAFLDICVRGTTLGKRSGGGWGLKGWPWVENEMKIAGHMFTKDQMRHKWYSLKVHWKLWKDLKGKETGLGWDPIKGTIDASDEWWNAKIQENASYASLREKGIGRDVYEKYEILFMDTVAIGEYAYAPSSRILPNDTEEDPIYNNVINLVQNNDLEEVFEDQLERMMNRDSVLGGLPIQLGDDTINFENTDRIDTQQNMGKQKRKVTFGDGATNKKICEREKKV
ncbi:L10-interacting MYB domain-containing protein-like [Euphorbia lathyris]|uniref:L10-interacting MYB domain-containing protein-like n=1 Tax=Euphorbia lathyris TaxID=212925 RepID=UPI003313190B